MNSPPCAAPLPSLQQGAGEAQRAVEAAEKEAAAARGGKGAESLPLSLQAPPAVTAAPAAERCFAEPRRLAWRRYRQSRKAWRERVVLAGKTVSSAALAMLLWRTAAGEAVPPMRWLLGAGSGLFVIAMLRLALFVALSAPRRLWLGKSQVRLSGLGVVRAEHLLRWTARPGGNRRREKEFVCIEIRCFWHGAERQWAIHLEPGAEAVELQRRLRGICPQPTVLRPAVLAPPQGALGAGLMSVAGARA